MNTLLDDKMLSSVTQEVLGGICYLLHASFLFRLLSDPQDGGGVFLRNVGLLSNGYTALYPRRENPSIYILNREQTFLSLQVLMVTTLKSGR
jgi:hypothetical protein